jgi:Plant protein of unknown function
MHFIAEDKAVPEEVHIFMKKRLDELPGEPFQDRSVTIFRLPGWIHENNKELCEPQLVAIGPYHHGKESLQTMEEHKWFALRDFLARNENVDLEVYCQAMRSLEAQARQCYSETANLKSEDFVRMLVLDGCFILEWFLKNLDEDDAFCAVGWAEGELLTDMVMLENQIPLFVIHRLLALKDEDMGQSPTCEDRCPLLELFSNVLKNKYNYLFQFTRPQISCDDIYHLLHFYYKGVVPDFKPQNESQQGNSDTPEQMISCASQNRQPTDDVPIDMEQTDTISYEGNESGTGNSYVPCISELHEAGVKFKRKEHQTSMLDISFNNGVIEMPFFEMETIVIRILWNMVAFEQSRKEWSQKLILSSYLALMDSLINTEKDVIILEQSGILKNFFQNAEEAATFFNQFDKYFILDYTDHYLYNLFKDVKEYSQSTRHRYRARLMHDYFSNPWTIISVVAAGILLILTVVQTIFSIIK